MDNLCLTEQIYYRIYVLFNSSTISNSDGMEEENYWN